MGQALLARVNTVAVVGIDAHPVTVECMRAQGLPGVRIIGLPDAAVREACDRVRAAIQHSGLAWPRDRVVLNLSPAALPKSGSGFDLAIALAVLSASAQLLPRSLTGVVVLGELGLDAAVQPSDGVLAAARWLASTQTRAAKKLLVPQAAAADAARCDGIDVVPVATLGHAVSVLRGDATPVRVAPTRVRREPPQTDLADVNGQHTARRAIEIAAAGRHHILLSGPFGSGKSMLARRLRDVLPDLTLTQALDVAAIESVAGVRHRAQFLDLTPPLREVHHAASASALLGGGSGLPRPGEVSRAHHGVLLLDELLEFRRAVLDTLRQPLERGEVTLSRARTQVTYPCRVQLVATTNACPCGRRGDERHACACRDDQVQQYWRRLSGPLHDRIDMHVPVRPVTLPARTSDGGETTAAVAARVARARAFVDRREPRGVLAPQATWERLLASATTAAAGVLDTAATTLALSARGQVRALAVARTIADLAESAQIGTEHVEEAIALRVAAVRPPR